MTFCVIENRKLFTQLCDILFFSTFLYLQLSDDQYSFLNESYNFSFLNANDLPNDQAKQKKFLNFFFVYQSISRQATNLT